MPRWEVSGFSLPFVFTMWTSVRSLAQSSWQSSVSADGRQDLKAGKIFKSSMPVICWKGWGMGDSCSTGVQSLFWMNSECDRADSWRTGSQPVVLVVWLLWGGNPLWAYRAWSTEDFCLHGSYIISDLKSIPSPCPTLPGLFWRLFHGRCDVVAVKAFWVRFSDG